jgi:hypothetical protein
MTRNQRMLDNALSACAAGKIERLDIGQAR